MPELKTRDRIAQLRTMTDNELASVVVDAQRAIYQVRRDQISKNVENKKATRNKRKDIARALTIKRERELGKNSPKA